LSIANWGLHLHENLIPVDTEAFETNVPGIFAMGHQHLRRQAKSLFCRAFTKPPFRQRVNRYVHPDKRLRSVHTSSTKIQKKLGVVS